METNGPGAGGGGAEERKIFEEIILCVLGYRRVLFLSVNIRIFWLNHVGSKH